MAESFAFTNFYGYYIENCYNIWPHAKLIISELLLWVNKTMNMYGNMSRYTYYDSLIFFSLYDIL